MSHNRHGSFPSKKDFARLSQIYALDRETYNHHEISRRYSCPEISPTAAAAVVEEEKQPSDTYSYRISESYDLGVDSDGNYISDYSQRNCK